MGIVSALIIPTELNCIIKKYTFFLPYLMLSGNLIIYILLCPCYEKYSWSIEWIKPPNSLYTPYPLKLCCPEKKSGVKSQHSTYLSNWIPSRIILQSKITSFFNMLKANAQISKDVNFISLIILGRKNYPFLVSSYVKCWDMTPNN